jgi:hypothetical protein
MAVVAGDGAAYRTLTAVMADHALRCRTFFAEQTRILHHQILAGVEGRLVEAEALATEHFELLRPFNLQEAIGMTGVMQVSVRREQGRVGEIIPAWATFPGAADTAGPVAATLAFAYAETGDLDEAASRVRAGAGHGFADAAQDATWWYVIAMWTEAAVMVRDREAAARLHELQIPYDGGISGTGGVCSGPFARLFALVEDLLDRHDDADRHFAEAIEQSQRLMSPVWTARCQLDWAERLATRGRLEHARRLVDQADEAIATLTLPRLQQQSAELRNKVT